MDRNSIIGLLLIGAILIGFSIYTQPSSEELLAQQKQQDSIALAEKNAKELEAKKEAEKHLIISTQDTLNDSLKVLQAAEKLGTFATAAIGTDTTYTLENELLKIRISAKGGGIHSVELKKYKRWDSLPLTLFDAKQSEFSMLMQAEGKEIQTSSLYFKPEGTPFVITGEDKKSFAMRLNAGPGKYVEYKYTLEGNSYMIGFDLNLVNMNEVIAPSSKSITFNWSQLTPSQEKSLQNQRAATTMYYKLADEQVDYISERSDEKEVFESEVKWVAFKQQFFTSVLIADKAFAKESTVETYAPVEDSSHVKKLTGTLSIPYSHTAGESFPMQIYFGPNHFQTLKKFDIELERQIPLGWGIFRWVNQFLVIPVFNFLNGFNINFGIIILILTVLIKLMLLPLTYKAYLSTAKMRVLKPELDELNTKYGNDDPLKKQQEMMTIYKRAGVNPMGGCLPMLLQMPILIAMFNFFPSSIELRQESFLWADDLSTYDSILDLGFEIPFYGDHVSLFTLLMTVSTILYTRMNNQLTPGGGGAMQEQMKWMMYLMPIIFLGVFNNYSSGLSYYYFLANMITFGQQFLFRQLVDDNKLRLAIDENKKKPVTKSKFQEKLEEMAKQKGVQLPQQGKKK